MTDNDHAKYITTSEFIKLTENNFAARLAPGNLECKIDIANVVKEAGFNDKINNLNKKLLQIKQNKLKMNSINYQKNETISTKKLTKDLINKHKILNDAKHFSSGI